MRKQFAEIPSLKIHFVEDGTGPAVFLLHGWPETWLAWRHVIPELSKKFRVIAPDLRGLGESSKPTSGYDVGTLGGGHPKSGQSSGNRRIFGSWP